MNSFTFVTLSYNHEKEIEVHLESIKNIVIKFGKGINVNFVLCDDCSKDRTVSKVKCWLEKNPVFNSIKINQNKINIGIVQNFIKAISLVETEDFKLLAGDDVYSSFNIFEFFKNFDDQILLTPVTPFGKVNGTMLKKYETNYRTLMYMSKQGKIPDVVSILNVIPAPGVFYKLSVVKDENLFKFLSHFKFIEDYPMWYYLFCIKKITVIVNNRSCIYYRVGSGISTDKKSPLHIAFALDLEEIRKIIKPKYYVLPKYINPYCYYWKLLKIRSNFLKNNLPVFFLPFN